MPQVEYIESRWVGGLRECPTRKLEDLVSKIQRAINGTEFESQSPFEKNLHHMTSKSLTFQMKTIQAIIDERNES